MVDDLKMFIRLDDAPEITIPIDWFSILRGASDKSRLNWRLIGHGEGIHWADLHKDILVEGLL